MTSNVLVVGECRVAAEIADELRVAGVSADRTERDVAAYDTVIFASTAGREEQKEAVQALERRMSADALLLVSAMGFSATEIASWCQRPERVVGWGVVPPVRAAKAVEVALPLQSHGCTTFAERAVSMVRRLGKEAVSVQDSAGLVLPRMVAVILNEAVYALMEGVADKEDIDTAMQLGTNYPHGPLRWADIIGLDQVLATLQGVYEEQGEDRYRPAPLLRRMVLSGRGFYEGTTTSTTTGTTTKGDETNA